MALISNERSLIVKNLPHEINEEECIHLLKSLGALSVQYGGIYGHSKYSVFADFPSHEHAWNVIQALHQRPILGKRLSVEFKLPNCRKTLKNILHIICKNDKPNEIPKGNNKNNSDYSNFNVFSPTWDPSYLVSSDLHYNYPAPTADILTNIVRSLVSCPALYTQCLHLMNRLHLPPPFDDPELHPGDFIVISKSNALEVNSSFKTEKLDDDFKYIINPVLDEMDLSSGPESELCSDSDTDRSSHRPSKLQKFKRTCIKKIVKKQLPNANNKCENVLPCFKTKSKFVESISNLFESIPISKKINLQVHVDSINLIKLNEQQMDNKEEENKGFGIITPTSSHQDLERKESIVHYRTVSNSIASVDMEFQPHKDKKKKLGSNMCEQVGSEDNIQHSSYDNKNSVHNQLTMTYGNQLTITTLSINQLISGCLDVTERENYKVFSKGYDPGSITSRLYVKNLAPLVCERDLYEIFGVFFMGSVENPNLRLRIYPESTELFSIRLLTEGRMKGQAFIGFKCELTAKQALESTNGYMLHSRPMVVHFARGAKANDYLTV